MAVLWSDKILELTTLLFVFIFQNYEDGEKAKHSQFLLTKKKVIFWLLHSMLIRWSID